MTADNFSRGLRRRQVCAFLAGLMGAGSHAAPGPAVAFRDPLDTPSTPRPDAARAAAEPLIAVFASSTRWVAVGLRGLIVYADAESPLWHQATVPLQSDLVAVQLLDQQYAWAAGHDSVILHSADAGASWRKQFDRNASSRTLPVHYQQRVAAGEAGMQRYLDQIKLNTEGEVSLPYLGVWFDDALTGYAVGAFGMIIATRDGGQTWTPWLDRIDNDEFLNLNNIRGIHGEVYIAGERGVVYRLDRQRQRFVAHLTGYKGSFFDIVGTPRCLVAFGLRGAAYRSNDGGGTWQAVATGVERSITAGTVLDDGRRIVLLTETGQALQSLDDGASFRPLLIPKLLPSYGAAATGRGRMVTAGLIGVQVHDIPSIAG